MDSRTLEDMRRLLTEGTGRLRELSLAPVVRLPPDPDAHHNLPLSTSHLPVELPLLPPSAKHLLEVKNYGISSVAPQLLVPGADLPTQMARCEAGLLALLTCSLFWVGC